MMKTIVRDFTTFSWIDIEHPTEKGLVAVDLPFKMDKNFLEDALALGHLPKIEYTPEFVFMILRAYTATEKEKVIEVKQISNKIAIFIHKKTVVTIHRKPFPFLSKVPNTFTTPNELVIFLINEVLATFEHPIRIQSDKMDRLEQNIFLYGGNNLTIEKLYFEKSKARLSKKLLVITENVISHFKVEEELNSSYQNLKDTLIDLILRTEEVFEDANALLNTYMTFTAQKNNDVMKLLTVFSAFFLPLTFIVGLYGMNFQNMPELKWEYGYYLVLFVMLLISLGVYLWFRKKKIL